MHRNASPIPFDIPPADPVFPAFPRAELPRFGAPFRV